MSKNIHFVMLGSIVFDTIVLQNSVLKALVMLGCFEMSLDNSLSWEVKVRCPKYLRSCI